MFHLFGILVDGRFWILLAPFSYYSFIQWRWYTAVFDSTWSSRCAKVSSPVYYRFWPLWTWLCDVLVNFTWKLQANHIWCNYRLKWKEICTASLISNSGQTCWQHSVIHNFCMIVKIILFQLSLASIHYLRSHFQEAIDIYKRILLDNRYAHLLCNFLEPYQLMCHLWLWLLLMFIKCTC